MDLQQNVSAAEQKKSIRSRAEWAEIICCNIDYICNPSPMLDALGITSFFMHNKYALDHHFPTITAASIRSVGEKLLNNNNTLSLINLQQIQ
jgi:hypothetical protein